MNTGHCCQIKTRAGDNTRRPALVTPRAGEGRLTASTATPGFSQNSTAVPGSTLQRSNTAEVGSLSVGWSYVFSPTFTLSTNFDFGVTSDAPGLHVAFRMPFVL